MAFLERIERTEGGCMYIIIMTRNRSNVMVQIGSVLIGQKKLQY